MRIYLVGYMGCGKSTIGRQIADILSFNFVDLDKFIEERHFKSVPTIFAEEGEAAFREKEKLALLEVSQFEDIIIATGGGAPCFFDNMDFMNANGVTIYIAPETEVLATRLLNSKTERPLIAGKKRAELITFINQALIIRAPFYEKATITIRDQQDLDPQFVVSAIQSLGLNG